MSEREPYRRTSHSNEYDMSLPPGETCGDCVHMKLCRPFIDRIDGDEVCDWSPSRFKKRAQCDDTDARICSVHGPLVAEDRRRWERERAATRILAACLALEWPERLQPEPDRHDTSADGACDRCRWAIQAAKRSEKENENAPTCATASR